MLTWKQYLFILQFYIVSRMNYKASQLKFLYVFRDLSGENLRVICVIRD